MASSKQIAFFDNLLNSKDFGEHNVNELREKFGALNQASASKWIEAALEREDKDTDNEPLEAPPF